MFFSKINYAICNTKKITLFALKKKIIPFVKKVYIYVQFIKKKLYYL